MIRYFSSGLYQEPFYTKHERDFYGDDFYEYIEYNLELLVEYYKIDFDFEDSDEIDIEDQTREMFWDALDCCNIHFEPLVFDERIALECGLTPFSYKGKNMLALSGYGMDLSPRLDAYQVLTHNTIDEYSRFFSTANRADEYFAYVVGKEVARKVLNAIS